MAMTGFEESVDGKMQYSKEELDFLVRQGIEPEEVLEITSPQTSLREVVGGNQQFVIEDVRNDKARKIITKEQVEKIIGEMSVHNEKTIFFPTEEEKRQGEFFFQISILLDTISVYWDKFLKEGEYRYLEKLKNKKNELNSLCLEDELKQYTVLSKELRRAYPFLFNEDEASFQEFLKIQNKLWEYLGGPRKQKREEAFVVDEKKINLKYLMHECFSAIEGRVTSVINPN